jgi:hypothetical protein
MMADDSDAETPTPAPAAKAGPEKADNSTRNKRLLTGAAIGIGSAALVAALLYANRARRSDRS